MGKLIKIGQYEIIDAELNADNVETISIPYNTNPGLSYQLDGWDPETSIPAWIDGIKTDLTLEHYDKEHHRWVLKKPA